MGEVFHRGFRWRFRSGGFFLWQVFQGQVSYLGFPVEVSCRGFLSGIPVGDSCRGFLSGLPVGASCRGFLSVFPIEVSGGRFSESGFTEAVSRILRFLGL